MDEMKWIKLLPNTKRGIKIRFVNSMVNDSASEAEISNDVDKSFSASSTSSVWTNGVKMTATEDEEEEFPPSPDSEPARKRRKRTTSPKKSPEVGTCPLCARNMKLRTLFKHTENCNGGVVTRFVSEQLFSRDSDLRTTNAHSLVITLQIAKSSSNQ